MRENLGLLFQGAGNKEGLLSIGIRILHSLKLTEHNKATQRAQYRFIRNIHNRGVILGMGLSNLSQSKQALGLFNLP